MCAASAGDATVTMLYAESDSLRRAQATASTRVIWRTADCLIEAGVVGEEGTTDCFALASVGIALLACSAQGAALATTALRAFHTAVVATRLRSSRTLTRTALWVALSLRRGAHGETLTTAQLRIGRTLTLARGGVDDLAGVVARNAPIAAESLPCRTAADPAIALGVLDTVPRTALGVCRAFVEEGLALPCPCNSGYRGQHTTHQGTTKHAQRLTA